MKNKNILTKPTLTIRHLFKFDIGPVISIFPVAQIGKLHHRTLEKKLFNETAGNFEINKKN